MIDNIPYEKYLTSVKDWETNRSNLVHTFVFLVHKSEGVQVANYLRSHGYKVYLTKDFAPNVFLSKIEITISQTIKR